VRTQAQREAALSLLIKEKLRRTSFAGALQNINPSPVAQPVISFFPKQGVKGSRLLSGIEGYFVFDRNL
jgi:hypothetical protein